MKDLIKDLHSLGISLNELLIKPTSRGQLHRVVRLSRPNWPAARCLKAGGWLRRNGLKPRHRFTSEEDYLKHLCQLLDGYAQSLPYRRSHQVADEVTLSRWEARWSRARKRSSGGRAATVSGQSGTDKRAA
ncbi:MAG: hypothetical protein ACQETD_04875 [Pseudomonadota bacterium]